MSRKQNSQRPPRCAHTTLSFEPSLHAEEVGYRRPTAQQRAAAAGKGKKDGSDQLSNHFPAPLVLPGDDLSYDPRWPPQSLLSWTRLKDRNDMTSERDVIYVAAPPDIDPEVEFIRSWSQPLPTHNASEPIPRPNVGDLIDYLTAFFYGIKVKMFSSTLQFTSWDDSENSEAKRTSGAPRFIGLSTGTECVRVRTRSLPKSPFQSQLNLDDLLDTAISVLPDDAYSLLMLVEHDLFENAEDEFTCGRAYGGSRVAVISTARDNPRLDSEQRVEREHAWPASHCGAYIQASCFAPSQPAKRIHSRSVTDYDNLEIASSSQNTYIPPLQAALTAYTAASTTGPSPSTEQLSQLWLGRACQTASHELGHCFGLDHCIYYGCLMQGSVGMSEGVRQPPYLCPVDLAKLLRATGADEKRRYEAVILFCDLHKDAGMFAAFAAWIRARLAALGGSSQGSSHYGRPEASTEGSKDSPIEL
ncbi:hypothetical protein MMC28_008060 [Mycoblastus sanguinarius]|nr:hypothetical protein [Mycoblastus sanguinarius]